MSFVHNLNLYCALFATASTPVPTTIKIFKPVKTDTDTWGPVPLRRTVSAPTAQVWVRAQHGWVGPMTKGSDEATREMRRAI
jgi:hypothetical protein